MGRKKKVVEIDTDKFSAMDKHEKLTLFSNFNQLFHYELSRIPYSEHETSEQGKAESIAEDHYRSKGYEVYRSRVNDGYRSIGVEFYWQSHIDKITDSDRELILKLKKLMSAEEFRNLAYLVKDKGGTPDLLLIKDERISFVEVKFNYETVKHPTVEFFIKHGDTWPTSILRIIRKA